VKTGRPANKQNLPRTNGSGAIAAPGTCCSKIKKLAPVEMGANFICWGISDAYSLAPSDPALPEAPRVADDPADRAEPRAEAADAPGERADCRAAIAGDLLAGELAAEPVRFSVAPRGARCARVVRVGWVPDDLHQACRHLAGSVAAAAHWAGADLGPDDCLAELMVADLHAAGADWAAPIPDGCSEQADSALADSAGPMGDDRYAPAVHPVPGGRWARADSVAADSAGPMGDDHCAPAVHPVPGGRWARADSVAAGYSADWLRGGC